MNGAIHGHDDGYFQRKLAFRLARCILVSMMDELCLQEMFNRNLAAPPFVFPATEAVAPAASRSKATASERVRAEDIRLLYQLASDFDSISPQLAAQLRGIAARH